MSDEIAEIERNLKQLRQEREHLLTELTKWCQEWLLYDEHICFAEQALERLSKLALKKGTK